MKKWINIYKSFLQKCVTSDNFQRKPITSTEKSRYKNQITF